MAIGVEIATSLRSGPSNPGTASGRFHIVGVTEKGPVGTSPVLRSIAQFESVYGVRTPYSADVYDAARLFWEEGGSEVVVTRVVGASAARGSLSLKDRAATPLDTIKIEAADPGSHSSALTIEVVDAGTNVFSVILRLDGEILQRFVGLTSPAAFVEAAYRNPYIVVTNAGSASTVPTNNPAPIAPTPLVAGTDDRAGITAADVVAAADAAGDVAPGGAIAAPGYTATAIGALLLAHAAATNKVALLALDVDATVAEAISAAASLSAGENGSYGGLFYPHLVVPDGARTRTVSPVGYVAAVRSRAHLQTGYWQVPAGERAATRWAVDTVTPVDTILNNTLADGLVNGIAKTAGRIRLYGWASLSADRENLGLLSVRDVLNNLTVAVGAVAEPHVFAGIDGRGYMFAKLRSDVVGVLDPIARAGGFYAKIDGDTQIDPGYSVTVDSSINTIESLNRGEVRIAIAVRLAPAAQLIRAEIIKVALSASV